MEEEHGTDIYRIRKIKLTALNDKFFASKEESSRIITHFHYITWPDFGVPEETGSFLEFLEKTNQAQILLKEEESIESPVIVHCSAGIGRSGAYVIVDCVLNYLQHGTQNDSNATAAGGDMISVPKSIEELVIFIRRHRMGLIQTPEQLRFCWQAIVDWLKAHPDGENDGETSSSTTTASSSTTNDPGLLSPNRKRRSQQDSSIEQRKQKIQEMRDKLRRVEESKNRWWYRILYDKNDNTKYWVGSSVAVLGAVFSYYVYNSIHASK